MYSFAFHAIIVALLILLTAVYINETNQINVSNIELHLILEGFSTLSLNLTWSAVVFKGLLFLVVCQQWQLGVSLWSLSLSLAHGHFFFHSSRGSIETAARVLTAWLDNDGGPDIVQWLQTHCAHCHSWKDLNHSIEINCMPAIQVVLWSPNNFHFVF